MRIRITLLSLLASLLSTGFIFTSAPVANAGCRDYPESVTPGCVAQNLAEEQARQAADVAKRAQDLIDAENRAKAQAAQEFVANGSRPCSVYPASITAACAAENLGVEQEKQKSATDKQAQALLDAEERAKENAEKDYIANGSRPCTLYPASITPECVAENLIDAAKKKVAMEEKMIQDLKDVEARAKENAEKDYIANGSRPCTLYPASITPECSAENLEYETKRQLAAAAKSPTDELA